MILLLRHGRTAANANGLLLGRLDVDLDDEGGRQAAALAAAVQNTTNGVRQVVSSPLQRCRATAETVAEALGLPVTVDERWIELDYGDLDGTPTASLPADTWARWMADTRWAPPGGESLADLGERVRSACDDLVGRSGHERDPSGDVVVVTHVSPIKAAVAWALDAGDDLAWRLHVTPASISRIGILGSRRVLRSFNEVSHLR
jgi:broad specificity phosphatase PhoE